MIFPLPFDAETAPYTLKNRQKHFPVPGFRKADKAVFFCPKDQVGPLGTSAVSAAGKLFGSQLLPFDP